MLIVVGIDNGEVMVVKVHVALLGGGVLHSEHAALKDG
jgi:hypothetical protein